VEALWALGALEPKKWLKWPDGGLGVVERVPKTTPKRRRFLPQILGKFFVSEPMIPTCNF
jgi:hypothetical protein